MYIGSIIWISSWLLSKYLELEIIAVFTFPTQYFGMYGEVKASAIELFLLDGDTFQNTKQILWTNATIFCMDKYSHSQGYGI